MADDATTPEAAPEAATPEMASPEAATPEMASPEAATPETTSAQPDTKATTTGDEPRPDRRKVREGIVVSDAMSATVVVAVVDRVRHPRYGKTVQRTKRLYCHDPADSAKVGDRVQVVETRPLSKLKRWRVAEVLERAR